MDEDSIPGPEGPGTPIERLLRRLERLRSLPGRLASTPALRAPGPSLDLAALDRREPSVDIVRMPSRVYVTIEIPGASRETIDVEAVEGRLTVRARTPEGRLYHEEIDLPDLEDPQGVRATYRNGVLDVTIVRRRRRIRRQDGESDGR